MYSYIPINTYVYAYIYIDIGIYNYIHSSVLALRKQVFAVFHKLSAL